MSRSDRRLPLLLAATTLLFVAGCSTFATPFDDLLFSENEGDVATLAMPAMPATTPAGPTFTVEVRPSSGRPEQMTLPLKQVTFAQQALEQSGALKRFSRVELQLYRSRSDAAGQYKVDLDFDRGSRRVTPSFDYAIHPGDRLIVIEDTSNVLDDVLESISSPLGGLLPRM